MTFRDAWDSVKGTSKEDAQKAYVDALVKVRFILSNLTGSCRVRASQHRVPRLLLPSQVLSIVCGRSADGAARQ